MKKKILTSVFSFVLTLFLAFSLLVGSLAIYAENTLCSPEKLEKIGTKSGYTTELYDQIHSSWENLLAITGVTAPEPILAILTPSLVEKDALRYISDSFAGKADISTKELETALDGKIRDYVKGQGEEIDEEVEKNIQELVSACIKKYEHGIRIPMLPKVLGAVSKLQKYLMPLAIGAFGFSLVLLVFLFFLQQKKKNILYYGAISASTGAMLLVGASFLSDHYELAKRLPLEESALRTLLSSYVQFLTDRLGQVGMVFFWVFIAFLFALLVIFAVEKIREGEKKEEKSLPEKENKTEEEKTEE